MKNVAEEKSLPKETSSATTLDLLELIRPQ